MACSWSVDASRSEDSSDTAKRANWALIATSFLFVLIRLFTRWTAFAHLFIDDIFVFSAWLLAFFSSLSWHWLGPRMYSFSHQLHGTTTWPPSSPDASRDLSLRVSHFYRGQLVVVAFFYVVLWAVKISFLLFFKHLGKDMRSVRILWWGVFTFAAASFVACFADMEYRCITASAATVLEACHGQTVPIWSLFSLQCNAGLDMVTDGLSRSWPRKH